MGAPVLALIKALVGAVHPDAHAARGWSGARRELGRFRGAESVDPLALHDSRPLNLRGCAHVSKRIRVPVQIAWEIVRTGASMDRWVPAITPCKLEGDGVGAKRVCVVDNHERPESIETIDDPTGLFQYRVYKRAMLPARKTLGTPHLSAFRTEETEVLWLVNFDLDDGSAWEPVRDAERYAVIGGAEENRFAGADGVENQDRGRAREKEERPRAGDEAFERLFANVDARLVELDGGWSAPAATAPPAGGV